jgi:hypothetical protein
LQQVTITSPLRHEEWLGKRCNTGGKKGEARANFTGCAPAGEAFLDMPAVVAEFETAIRKERQFCRSDYAFAASAADIRVCSTNSVGRTWCLRAAARQGLARFP